MLYKNLSKLKTIRFKNRISHLKTLASEKAFDGIDGQTTPGGLERPHASAG
jgi:hypothetical protein